MGRCRLFWSQKSKGTLIANRQLGFAQTILRNTARGNMSTLIAALRLGRVPRVLSIVKDKEGHSVLCILLSSGKESDAHWLYEHFQHKAHTDIYLCSSPEASSKVIEATLNGAPASPPPSAAPRPAFYGDAASEGTTTADPRHCQLANELCQTQYGGASPTSGDAAAATTEGCPVHGAAQRCSSVKMLRVNPTTPFDTFRVIWQLLCECESAPLSTAEEDFPSSESPPPPYTLGAWQPGDEPPPFDSVV